MENKLNDDYLSYEQTVALHGIGFDDDCILSWYELEGKKRIMHHLENYISMLGYRGTDLEMCAPTKSQVFRWFRDKYGWDTGSSVYLTKDRKKFYSCYISIEYKEGDEDVEDFGILDEIDGDFNTYEEAENACINKLIKTAKQQAK